MKRPDALALCIRILSNGYQPTQDEVESLAMAYGKLGEVYDDLADAVRNVAEVVGA